MRWREGRTGGNVEDRRGLSGGKTAAGGGIGVIVIALVAYFVFGISPEQTLKMASQFGGAGAAERQDGTKGTPEDEAGAFVDIVSANVTDVWKQLYRDYQEPKVIIYNNGTQTGGCGYGQAAMGPFYCPADQAVYLDLEFWTTMEKQLGASGADFARAYVIAHEFGHHIQNLMGTNAKVRKAQNAAGSKAEANKYQVAMELQADCYAGVWAANASKVSNGRVAMEAGDIEEGLKTAKAIGDDALMRNAGQKVTPEAFTHGTSEQRMEWLRRGYRTGDPRQCDTFGG